MFCHKCGTKLLDEATFCHKCGAKLSTDTVSPSTSSKGISEEERVRSILHPYEEAAQKGPITFDKFSEGSKLLASVIEANDPFVENYKKVLSIYVVADQGYFELFKRWFNHPIELAARPDWKMLLRKDYRKLFSKLDYKDEYIEQLINSPAIFRLLDQELFKLLLAVYIYRGRFKEITTSELVAFDMSRMYGDDFLTKTMEGAKNLVDIIHESPEDFGIRS